jgi:hypothetical protein
MPFGALCFNYAYAASNNLLDSRNGTINDDEPDDLPRINLLAPPFNVLPLV